MSGEFVASDQTLVDLLREEGSLSIAEMVERLGVTATAVRQRLTRLSHQQLVQREDNRGGRGRPSHRYSLTELGRRKSGENFADLATVFWRELCDYPDEAVRQKLVRRIASSLASTYAGQIHGNSLADKMRSLARLLGERRIPVSVGSEEGLPVLTVHACPYPDLSRQDSTICEMEESMLSELLGRELHLHQCETKGGCNCHFEPASPSREADD